MSDYWDKRAAEDMVRAQRDALEAMADIEKLHRAALSRVQEMARRLRRRFMSAYGLTREEAAKLIQSPCGREEYLKLLEEIGRLGKKNPKRDELLARAASGAYAYRESVQQAMEDEITAVTARLAEQEAARLEMHLSATAQESSLRAGFRIAKETGLGFAFGGVNEELARQLIHRPWSGKEFCARIWQNQDALADALNDKLREGLVTGRSTEKIAEDLSERMGVSMSRARTLVRTETTYAYGQADLEAYKELGYPDYRYRAVLDMRTSKACQELDGQILPTDEAVPGKNFPPMHPNCRSLVSPVPDEEQLRRMERWARDPVTGKGAKVPSSMTYGEWLQMQKETYGEERIETARRMAVNKKADQRQFERYQAVMGKKRLPSTLEKFQMMKYTEADEWNRTKRSYERIQSQNRRDAQ